MAAALTERRAAHAARQLAHHRDRLAWMERRMQENEAALESYLALAGETATTLPGGWALELDDAGEVSVRRPDIGARYEQLKLEV